MVWILHNPNSHIACRRLPVRLKTIYGFLAALEHTYITLQSDRFCEPILLKLVANLIAILVDLWICSVGTKRSCFMLNV